MTPDLHDGPRAVDITAGPRAVLTQVASLTRKLTGARHATVVLASRSRTASIGPRRDLVVMPLAKGRGVLRAWDKDRGFTNADRTILATLAVLAPDLIDGALAYRRSRQISARSCALVRSAPLPIVEMDQRGRCLVWNSAAERFFGWTADDVTGRVCPAVPERLRPELFSVLRRAFAGETVPVVETIRERKDGSLVDVSISVAPVLADSGAVVGAMAIISDRGERKLLQRQLDQLRAAMLSPRERQVVRLLREGSSYRDVARALGRSEGTVRTLVHRAYRKLGVHSRIDLPALI